MIRSLPPLRFSLPSSAQTSANAGPAPWAQIPGSPVYDMAGDLGNMVSLRTLNGSQLLNSGMTPTMCLNYCFKLNFAIAGTENAGEWCVLLDACRPVAR